MSRTAITRGSLYNGSLIMAIIHFVLSVILVLVGIYIMKEFTMEQVTACLFLLFAVVGLVASTLMVTGLFLRSSVLSFTAFLLVFLEAVGFIVLFGLYFFELLDISKALTVGDQNFAMSVNAIQIFISLYFTFAYSRVFRYLYPTEEEIQA